MPTWSTLAVKELKGEKSQNLVRSKWPLINRSARDLVSTVIYEEQLGVWKSHVPSSSLPLPEF